MIRNQSKMNCVEYITQFDRRQNRSKTISQEHIIIELADDDKSLYTGSNTTCFKTKAAIKKTGKKFLLTAMIDKQLCIDSR